MTDDDSTLDWAVGDEVPMPRTEGETLVADDRANLTPSQHVEQKLIGILSGSSVMVSQVERRLRPGPR